MCCETFFKIIDKGSDNRMLPLNIIIPHNLGGIILPKRNSIIHRDIEKFPKISKDSAILRLDKEKIGRGSLT